MRTAQFIQGFSARNLALDSQIQILVNDEVLLHPSHCKITNLSFLPSTYEKIYHFKVGWHFIDHAIRGIALNSSSLSTRKCWLWEVKKTYFLYLTDITKELFSALFKEKNSLSLSLSIYIYIYIYVCVCVCVCVWLCVCGYSITLRV